MGAKGWRLRKRFDHEGAVWAVFWADGDALNPDCDGVYANLFVRSTT